MQTRLFVAVPSYKPTPEMRAELDSFAQALGPDTVVEIKESCSIIEMARATLEERFLKTDSTHILWRDDDIRVDAQDILAVVDEDLDVVGLGCRNRHTPEKRAFNVRPLHHGAGDLTPRVIVRPSGRRVVEAAGVGFGCILVRRRVVEKLWRRPDLACESLENPGATIAMTFLPSIRRQIDGVRRFIGEDLSWCERAREAGFHVYAMLGVATDHGGLADVFDEDTLRVHPVLAPEASGGAAPALNRSLRRALAAARR